MVDLVNHKVAFKAQPVTRPSLCIGHATVTRPRKVNTYQVINAQKQGLDAAIALTIPAGSDAQINPHQLGQELQGEASQAVFRAPVQLEQLVAHRLQELDHRWKQENAN